MNDLIGKRVSILMTNGIAVDGIIFQFGDNKINLHLLDNSDLMFIMNVERDVQLIRVFSEKKQDQFSLKEKLDKVQNDFKTKANEIHSKDQMRIKKLGELKINLINQERKIAKEKLVDHVPGVSKISNQDMEKIGKGSYEFPGFLRKK